MGKYVCPSCGETSDNVMHKCPKCGFDVDSYNYYKNEKPISEAVEKKRKTRIKNAVISIVIVLAIFAVITIVGTVINKADVKQREVDSEIIRIEGQLEDSDEEYYLFADYLDMVDKKETVGYFSSSDAKMADTKIQSKLDSYMEEGLKDMTKDEYDPFKSLDSISSISYKHEGGLEEKDGYEDAKGKYYVDKDSFYKIESPTKILYENKGEKTYWDICSVERVDRHTLFLFVRDSNNQSSETVFALINSGGWMIVEGSGTWDIKSNHVTRLGIKFERDSTENNSKNSKKSASNNNRTYTQTNSSSIEVNPFERYNFDPTIDETIVGGIPDGEFEIWKGEYKVNSDFSFNIISPTQISYRNGNVVTIMEIRKVEHSNDRAYLYTSCSNNQYPYYPDNVFVCCQSSGGNQGTKYLVEGTGHWNVKENSIANVGKKL